MDKSGFTAEEKNCIRERYLRRKSIFEDTKFYYMQVDLDSVKHIPAHTTLWVATLFK